jgi:Xaa-Pro aminopeptidase
MKPGMKFSELVARMEEPLKTSGCWSYTPLLHSVGPHFLMGRSGVNAINLRELGVRFQGAMEWRVRDAVLQEGMVFAFEPNACIDRHRVNIGGTVVVTARGCEELNQIPTTVTHKQ